MRTLIKGGIVATASDLFKAEVLIEDEKISLIGMALPGLGSVDRVIDASGKYIIPGGIDPHTHLDMPFGGTQSSDDFETGTRAAAFGGTTCLIDFAIQPAKGSLRQGLEEWHRKAEGKACIDYGFHMIARDIHRESLAEMDQLVKREGVTSFKLFTAYPGVFLVDAASIFRAMQKAGDNGALICMHAENGPVIDVLIEQALAGALGSRGDPPGDLARRGRSSAGLHCPPLRERGLAAGSRGPRPWRPGDGGDLSAIPLPVLRELRGARLRGSEVRDEPASSGEGQRGGPLGWAETG